MTLNINSTFGSTKELIAILSTTDRNLARSNLVRWFRDHSDYAITDREVNGAALTILQGYTKSDGSINESEVEKFLDLHSQLSKIVFNKEFYSKFATTLAINQSHNRMATDIGSLQELDSLTQINGVPITLIEQRARPCADSHCGFLGPTQSFLDVLRKDWQTVIAAETTHIAIAEHLETVVKVADSDDIQKQLGTITYKNRTTQYRAIDFYHGLKEGLEQLSKLPAKERVPLPDSEISAMEKRLMESVAKARKIDALRVDALGNRNRTSWAYWPVVKDILRKEKVDPETEDRELIATTLDMHTTNNPELRSKVLKLTSDYREALESLDNLEASTKAAEEVAKKLRTPYYNALYARALHAIEEADKTGVEILFVTRSVSMGSQLSIFRKVESDETVKGGIDKNSTEYIHQLIRNHHKQFTPGNCWGDEFDIRNRRTNVTIRVSGGSIDPIKRFGFYEGEEKEGSNPYRLDPEKVLCVLSGMPYRSSTQAT